MKKWLILILITGCKVSSFTTIVAQNTLFSSFKTFTLVEYRQPINITQPEYDNPENRALINETIRDEMSGWGYTERKDSSDIIVTYTLLIRDIADTRLDSAVIYKPWIDSKQDSFSYTEGAFTLIFMNGANNKMLAQSQLQSVMDRNPVKFKAAIPQIIKRMFKRINEEQNGQKEHN